MRTPVSLFLFLFLSISVYAAEVRFSTEHPRLYTSNSASVFIHNTGSDTIDQPRVSILLAPELEFFHPPFTSNDWTCTVESATRATCSAARMAPEDYLAVSFAVRATNNRGGHYAATATLTARNLSNVPPIIFDFISSRVIEVTTTADFGAGSLRGALEEINGEPLCGTDVACNVSFSGPMTIRPATPLPPIRKCNVSISGPYDIEFPVRERSVVISGENATHGNGLELRAACIAGVSGISLNALVVNSWPWNGIYVETPAANADVFGHSINNSYIGTDATGVLPRPNLSRGIVTDSPHDVLAIRNSIVSANARSGIALYRGKHVTVVGTAVGGGNSEEPLGNGASGIFTWGVPVTITNSLIANNAHAGVAIARGTQFAYVNRTHIHSNAGLPIDWALDDRTLADDESDRILNTPRVLDAFYDASTNRTIVRGTVRLRGGVFAADSFTIEVYLASTTRGDIASRVTLAPFHLTAPAGGNAADVEFEIPMNGDLRGRLIALQTYQGSTLSSEISEALPVR